MDIIKDWIIGSYENKKLSFNSCIFMSGYSGIGKTYCINNLCKNLELFIINIDSFNCCTSAQLSDLLYKSFVSSLIQTLTNNHSRKIIIIDDFDILLSLDSTINITLHNFIQTNTDKLKHIPIICIINNNNVKRLGDIKKKCKIFETPKLSDNEIYEILKSYKNDIKFSEVTKIIDSPDFNLSNAIRIVTDTYFNHNDDIIAIDDLYSNVFNRNNLRRIINKEQWIIPLNFHENLITELYENRKGIKKQKELFYKSFMINLCYFDIIMSRCNEIGIELFICIIEGLFKIPNKKNKNLRLSNFTKMLSYLSLQKKTNKSNYNKSFPFQHIGNYHLTLINRKFIY
jgi:hypothetical protein